MVRLYLPTSSLPAGKLNWPLSFDTTVVVMVEPSFLALTRTPSIMPSSTEETWPLSVWACAAVIRAKLAAVASRRDFNCMVFSLKGRLLERADSEKCRMFARFHVPANGPMGPGFRGGDTVETQMAGTSPAIALLHANR